MSTPALVPQADEPLSQGARVANMFFTPSKSFRDISRSASWWLPFLIIVIASYTFVAVIDKKVGFDKVTENQIRLNPKRADQLDQLPADQRAKQMNMAAKFTRYISYGTPVITLIFLMVIALVLWGSYSFGAGVQVSFGKSMAVVTYANLVGIIKALLAVVAIFAGLDTDNFNIQNPVATNLGFLFDPIQHKVLYSLGSSIDIVNLAVMALVALGFTYITKVKRGTSFAIVFGWWILVTLLGVAAAAIF
jgi:Yip1 domain